MRFAFLSELSRLVTPAAQQLGIAAAEVAARECQRAASQLQAATKLPTAAEMRLNLGESQYTGFFERVRRTARAADLVGPMTVLNKNIPTISASDIADRKVSRVPCLTEEAEAVAKSKGYTVVTDPNGDKFVCW